MAMWNIFSPVNTDLSNFLILYCSRESLRVKFIEPEKFHYINLTNTPENKLDILKSHKQIAIYSDETVKAIIFSYINQVRVILTDLHKNSQY